MTFLAVLLLFAAAAHGLARWLNLPLIPLLLIAGAAIPRLIVVEIEVLQDALILGLTFLLFASGIELSPKRVGRQTGAAIRVGLVQFFALGTLGMIAAAAAGFDLVTSTYVGLVLAASSTLLAVALLRQRRQLFEPFGRLVLGVLLLQDILVILSIPLITGAPQGIARVALASAGTAALVAVAYVCARWVSPWVASLRSDGETLLLALLSVLFFFVGGAHLLALPLAVGAFLAGIAISPFPLRGIARGQLVPVSDFFTAMFFVALGGLLATPTPRELAIALGFAALIIVLTPLIVTVLTERAGFSARPALESGMLLAQTSELSLVLALNGLVLGQIEPGVFTIVVLVTVTTMVLTPFLSAERVILRLLHLHPMRGRHGGGDPPRGHVLLLGCGEGGLPMLETLITAGEDVFVIDDDPEVIARLQEGDVRCLRGDASDLEVLRAAGAEHARLISSTIRRPRDNELLLQRVREVPVLVRVFEDEDAEWARQHGAIPVVYSEAAADEFLAWFDRKHGPEREAAEVPAPGTAPPRRRKRDRRSPPV
jgi:Kef-type K+ transport system membrane component KefB